MCEVESVEVLLCCRGQIWSLTLPSVPGDVPERVWRSQSSSKSSLELPKRFPEKFKEILQCVAVDVCLCRLCVSVAECT